MRVSTCVLVLVLTSRVCGIHLAAQTYPVAALPSDPHDSDEWRLVAPHLPDPLHASPQRLETAGDVLRARRFPGDAVRFYKAAVEGGGDAGRLLKKQGVVHLELQHGQLARLCFQQAVRLSKRDAEAWNDLGASDFMLGNLFSAVSEYKHAIKMNRESAIFRSNLALAYFEQHEPQKARKQLARAFALDPDILHHNKEGGFNLQVLGAAHYSQICFEMFRVYATQNEPANAVEWLLKAAERGFDVRTAIGNDATLLPYLDNERIRAAIVSSEESGHAAGRASLRTVGLANTASR